LKYIYLNKPKYSKDEKDEIINIERSRRHSRRRSLYIYVIYMPWDLRSKPSVARVSLGVYI